ncbi:hypothetical protein [Sediminitomix flava]|uniref:Uncharacterized protein n=1 Tax=Sediminitomix flava TaxID=379075 RepID=A0A315Z2F9_SEDFL|nr:hypothetical protein [Sediminitomix flava]PWJ36180.1 hypothetical protein BC781_109199 [Sediminitomix flava]
MPIIRTLITILLVCFLPARIHSAVKNTPSNHPIQVYLFDKPLTGNETITFADLSNTFLALKEGYSLEKGTIKVLHDNREVMVQQFHESTEYHEWIRTKLATELSLEPKMGRCRLNFQFDIRDENNQKHAVNSDVDLSAIGKEYSSDKVNFSYQNKPIDSKLLLASRFSETELNIDASLKLKSVSVLLAKDGKPEYLEEVTSLDEYHERLRDEVAKKMQTNVKREMYAVSYIFFLENEKGILIQQSRILNIYPY